MKSSLSAGVASATGARHIAGAFTRSAADALARTAASAPARAFAAAGAATAPAGLAGCVDQHPYKKEGGGNRIVATSAAVLGICDRLDIDLVGIPATSSSIPQRYEGIDEVGKPMAPDLEILSSLHPDYVISPLTLVEDLQPKYAACGVASIFLDLKSVQGMYDSIDYLARKFDRAQQAAALSSEYEQAVSDFRRQAEGVDAPRVLLLMGVPGSYLVATEHSYAGSLVALAGGVNVYGELTDEFANISAEDMQSRDPEVILRTAHALPDEVKAMFAEEFATNDVWRHFRAVQQGRVYDLSYEYFGMSATFDYPKALRELYGYLYGSTVQAGEST